MSENEAELGINFFYLFQLLLELPSPVFQLLK